MSRLSMRLSIAESGVRVTSSDFKIRSSQLLEETLESLQSIWSEAGYEETECQGLLGDILTKFKTLCTAELAAEQQILEHAKNQVLGKMEEYEQLCAKLGRDAPSDDSCMGDNYADKLSRLEVCISDIEVEVSQRKEVLDQKRTEVLDLAADLGEVVDQGFDGGDKYCELADDRLSLMAKYLEGLEVTRVERVKDIRAVISECAKSMTDLVVPQDGVDSLPEHDLYADVDNAVLHFLNSGTYTHGVHQNYLKKLSQRLESLGLEKETRREELAKNGAEIARMWTLLRVSSAEREQFQSSFEMNLSMATLCKGREELARLQVLRLESLSTVVSSLREEIDSYWAELGVQADEQKEEEFPSYFVPVESLADNAIEEHEAFCEQLRVKVEQLRPLLAKIAKRENIVEERVELEHLMQNPERLTARGPKAREDRKREEDMQRRVKNLEKITKELLGHISTWEESNDGSPFLYAGQRYADRVAEQEESYIEARNALRNQRKKKDGKPESHAPPPKTTAKKFSSTTPSSSSSLHNSGSHAKASKENLSSSLNSSAKKALPRPNTASKAPKTPHGALKKSAPATASAKVTSTPLQERDRNSSGSDFSDVTECTGITEVKDAVRTSSATAPREVYETY